MNKTEVVVIVAKETSLTKKEVMTVLNAVHSLVEKVVASGGRVRFRGFGTFGSSDHLERPGVNPITGKPMTIPAQRLPTFKPHTRFKDRVNTK